MGNQIDNISVNISSAVPVTQMSFGMALIAGTTVRPKSLRIGNLAQNNDPTGIVLSAVDDSKYIDAAIVVSGTSTVLSVSRSGAGSSTTPWLITVNLATDLAGLPLSTAAEVKAAIEAVGNIGGASAIVEVGFIGTSAGTGVMSAVDRRSLVVPGGTYFEITDHAELTASYGFQATDPEYLSAQALFSQNPRMDTIAVVQLDSYATLVTELNALRDSGKDAWYWFLIASRNKADIILASNYINGLKKYGVYACEDKTVLDTIVSADRTLIVISTHADDFPDAAVVGRCGTPEIGSINWDSKTMNGQRNSEVSKSDQSEILTKTDTHGVGNIIGSMGGQNGLWEGKSTSGMYADLIHQRDYIEARLTEAWHSLKINTPKLPMNKSGLNMLEASLREVFRDCGRRGIISEALSAAEKAKSDMGDYQYKLIMPVDVSEITTNDRANRKVSPIRFVIVIGGGINRIEISGSMEV